MKQGFWCLVCQMLKKQGFWCLVCQMLKFSIWLLVHLRAFSSTIVKILAFTISKHYFYDFNTSFYNIPNIKHSIFFTTSFKYSFFKFFFFLNFSLSLCLSLPLSLHLSQPTASHCQPPPQSSLTPIPIATTATTKPTTHHKTHHHPHPT